VTRVRPKFNGFVTVGFEGKAAGSLPGGRAPGALAPRNMLATLKSSSISGQCIPMGMSSFKKRHTHSRLTPTLTPKGIPW